MLGGSCGDFLIAGSSWIYFPCGEQISVGMGYTVVHTIKMGLTWGASEAACSVHVFI